MHLLSGQPTISISQIQQSLAHKKNSITFKLKDPTYSHCQSGPSLNHHFHSQQSQAQSQQVCREDLKVTSAIYKRICQKSNCQCAFHGKRKFTSKNRLHKFRTQADEKIMKQISNLKGQYNSQSLPLAQNSEINFHQWKKNLTKQQIRQLYFKYLSTLPKHLKVKRQPPLDCYNPAFQEFLKSHFLIILCKSAFQDSKEEETSSRKRKNREMIKFHNKKSLREQEKNKQFMLQTSENKEKNENCISGEGGDFQNQSPGIRSKKLTFQEDERTLKQTSSNQSSVRNILNKKLKGLSNRSSFFSFLDEGDSSHQILKLICSKIAREDANQNQEAESFLNLLVHSEFGQFERICSTFAKELEEGIVIGNLPSLEVDLLVKIVLNKIKVNLNRKSSDVHSAKKLDGINSLIQKYGFSQFEKRMSLDQFWKIKSNRSLGVSRKSIRNQKDSKKSNFNKEEKKVKLKLKFSDCPNQFSSNAENNVQSNIIEQENSLSGKEENDEKCKYLNANVKGSPLNKMQAVQNVKRVQNKMKTIVNAKCLEKEIEGQIGIHQMEKKKTMASNFGDANICSSSHDFESVKYVGDSLLYKISPREKDRYSSTMMQHQHLIRNHFEKNKKFLKKMEELLIEKECQTLVINLNDGVITKKRKIRAIYQALEEKTVEKKQYYNEILKYLEIYSEYCQLVVKNRKDKEKEPTQKSRKLIAHSNFQINDDDFQFGEISNLIEDLKKERQLNFVNLYSNLQEPDDLSENLILKIPQYTTDSKDIHLKKRKLMASMHSLGTLASQYEQQSLNQKDVLKQKDLSNKFVGQKIELREELMEEPVMKDFSIVKETIQERWQRNFEAKMKKYKGQFRKNYQ